MNPIQRRLAQKLQHTDNISYGFYSAQTYLPVTYLVKKVNQSLAKLPLIFNAGLAKLGLTSLVK